MPKKFYLLLIAPLLVNRSEGTETIWGIEVYGGSAYNFTTPLTIHQSGYDDIRLNARYDTRPLGMPPYYDVRLSRWNGERGWALELIHQKLHLVNKPPAVENFAISHGYNLIDLSRAWRYKGFIFHLGGGVVMAHPEATVRGKVFFEKQGFLGLGWFISGPTGQIAIGREIYSYKRLSFNLEGKVTGSYAWVRIEDGKADVPNIAVHGLLGLRYNF